MRTPRVQGEQDAGELPGMPGGPFSERPLRSMAPRGKSSPELAAARMLSRQLPRKRALAEKRRLAHLICLNLLAILKRRSQQI